MSNIMTAPEFPELEPLIQVSKGQPYPIEQLPPRMREAAEAIAYHVQAPLPLAGNAVISSAAYLAQRLVNAPDPINEHGQPCSLFTLTLGNSGDRKSSCRNLACKAIDEREKRNRQLQAQRLAEIQEQAEQMKPKEQAAFLRANAEPDAQTLFTDTTFESLTGGFIRGASACAWDTDEGGQVLGGHSLKSDTRNATLGGLTKVFDNGKIERNRSKANAEGSGVAYNRRLTVSLLAQEIVVREELTDPLLQGQGFLARFLFASAESLAGTRFLTSERMEENACDDPRLQSYWQRCRELLDRELPKGAEVGEVGEVGELDPPVLPMDDEAKAVWRVLYNETEGEQAQGGDLFGLRPFASRAGQLAYRLAAVFACFEGLDTIDADTMNRACAFVRYSLSEWSRYVGRGAADPLASKAQALIDWLISKGIAAIDKATLNRLGKEGPTRGNAKQRDAVIKLLVNHRYLLPDGEALMLNPQIHAVNSAESAESAEPRASAGSASADQVRKGAEKVRSNGNGGNSSADRPHSSAPLPQSEPRAVTGFPHNPHNPQGSRYEI